MMEGRSVPEVADALGINRSALSRVIKGRVTISADLACRLSRGFGLYTETWLEMQAEFDAWQSSTTQPSISLIRRKRFKR